MKPIVRLARAAYFSAGHRYARADRTDEQNRALYGALFAPAGFGHNFRIEGHFEGPIDPETGMIENLVVIDRWLKEVTTLMDHHFLNRDLEFFRENPPTLENIARFCFEQISERMKAPLTGASMPTSASMSPSASMSTSVRLFKVRAYEGDATWVDWFHPDSTQAEREL